MAKFVTITRVFLGKENIDWKLRVTWGVFSIEIGFSRANRHEG